jgi:8-oxo-dGTP pyrophosphatase MutT (NUDIX family)
MDDWRRLSTELVHDCRVFRLQRARYERSAGDERSEASFYVVDAPEWINVIPLTPEREVVMIRQFRYGTDRATLEIPGGMVDPGEDPAAAAPRELREETGCEAERVSFLGAVEPNPAIQNNRCHSFLAEGVRPVGTPQPDAHESFEVVRVPLDEIPARIADGTITHSLVVAAFYLFGNR